MAKTLALALALTASVQAHMQLHYPPPFGAENNPHRTDSADKELDFPYGCCDKKAIFPCGGYLDQLGTDQGAPVATWEAGSKQNFSLTGQSTHWGGSCQAGFSVDKGETWQVVKSWEGNCPHREGGTDSPGEQTFDFTIPDDIPSGDAVFAWTWFNREQEFYMNCASVSIEGGSGNSSDSSPSSASSSASSSSQTPTSSSTSASKPTQTSRNGGDSDYDGDYDGGYGGDRGGSGGKYDRPHHKEGYPGGYRKGGGGGKGGSHRSGSWNRHQRSALTKREDSKSVAFNERPGFLVADIDNGCTTPKTKAEVKYPDPGPDVEKGDGEYPLELPSGKCESPK